MTDPTGEVDRSALRLPFDRRLTGCGNSVLLGAAGCFASPASMVRTIDAWGGRADGGAVQLSEPRGDGTERSPAAGHPAAGERGTGAAVTRLRAGLCPDGPGLDRPGKVAASVAAAGVL